MDKPNISLKMLEGRYRTKKDKKTYVLFLAGPNTSKYDYGEYFTFSIETLFEEGGGIQEIFFGSYKIRDHTILLQGKRRSQESWDKFEQEEGEAFIEDIKDYDIECEILSSVPKIHLKLTYNQKEIDLFPE